ncbi:hypothetical protein ARMGADRAFT_510104 [Armillaria gallica]|uniref:Uncharacterized protein n=1 Tax=Armillaria gallica TaxID=47427 RepID=A0A2H3DZR9_ARMGA|nr:hypothetical protein ARMGADRAFT_510104 [Armillaria gallica]
MAFEACLCTATSPHHLVLSSSIARLPRYDRPILLALAFRPSASGLITAPLCNGMPDSQPALHSRALGSLNPGRDLGCLSVWELYPSWKARVRSPTHLLLLPLRSFINYSPVYRRGREGVLMMGLDHSGRA